MTSDHIIQAADRILVTGANGFIGAKVVETLLEYGFRNIRCMVRPSSRCGRLEDVVRTFGQPDGVSVVVHLAAGFDKSFAGAFMNSALATRNLIEAFLAAGRPVRFVNVSSFA